MKKNYLVILLFFLSFSLSYVFSDAVGREFERFENVVVGDFQGELEIARKKIEKGRERLVSENQFLGIKETLEPIFLEGKVMISQIEEKYFSGNLTLGDLFILDKLLSSDQSRVLDPEKTTLGDLVIIDRVFSADSRLLDNERLDLDDLVVLDKLLSEENSNIPSSDITLEDILILEDIFQKSQILKNVSE